MLSRKRRLCFLAGSSYPAEVCNEMKGTKYKKNTYSLLNKKSFVNKLIIISLVSYLGGIKYRMGSGDSAVAFVKYNHQFFGIRTTAIHIALT